MPRPHLTGKATGMSGFLNRRDIRACRAGVDARPPKSRPIREIRSIFMTGIR